MLLTERPTDAVIDWAEAERHSGWALANVDGLYDEAWNARAEKWAQTLELGMEDWAAENAAAAVGLSPEDSVIDVCCGPGRLTLPMKKHCRRVTGLDGGDALLRQLRLRAAKHGISGIDTINANWFQIEPSRDLPDFDVAVGCNSPALGDIQKFSRAAKKKCVYINLCRGPLMQQIIDDVYAGCIKGLPDRSPEPEATLWDEPRSNFPITFNRLIALGAYPEVKYVLGGWNYEADSFDALAAHFGKLNDILPGKEKVFHENISRYSTIRADGTVTFRRTHMMVVMQWDPAEVRQNEN